MPDQPLRVTRYGALAGAIVGITATALVTIVYLYFAHGRDTANPDGAVGGALLLGTVIGFPGSLVALAVIERLALAGPNALLAAAIASPLINWLVLGATAGALVDAGRWIAGRRAGRH